MAISAFLKMDPIKGSAIQKGREDRIAVCGVSHETPADLDVLRAVPSGKPHHKPLVVIKTIDRASPDLFTALHKSTVFPQARLEFWRMPPSGGQEENHCSILLEDVQVASIKNLMYNNKNPLNVQIPVLEEVGLAYKKISWEWHAGGNVGGTAPKENSSAPAVAVNFAIPSDATLKAFAFDLLKTALVGTGTAAFKAVHGDSPPPACCAPPPKPK